MIALFHWLVFKKWLKRCAIVLGVIYVLGLIEMNWPRPPICPIEKHSFKGLDLDVEFCLSNASDRKYMGIRVYSKLGELLALRTATFAKESRLNYMAIEDHLIRYSDSPLDRINPPADCVLNMPPTWVDWVEARLPGGIPGVNHCGTASEAVVTNAQDQWELRINAERQKQGLPPP